jgi:flagellar biosynthesis/type III secretory pathway protein FliH
MTNIIKFGTATSIEPEELGEALARREISAMTDGMGRLHARVEQLEQQLEEKSRAARQAEVASEQARIQAYEEGRLVGQKEAETREGERLDALEQALSKAIGQLAQALGGAERLAALLARDCLDIVFGQSDDRASMVLDLLARQIAGLAPGELIEVQLAQSDFLDRTALDTLAGRMGLASAQLVLRSDLRSGDARLRLRLGENDIGLDTQWKRLSEALIGAVEEA